MNYTWPYSIDFFNYLYPIGSMVLLYMVTFTINIPPMLAYIPAPWILWVGGISDQPRPWNVFVMLIQGASHCQAWLMTVLGCSKEFVIVHRLQTNELLMYWCFFSKNMSHWNPHIWYSKPWFGLDIGSECHKFEPTKRADVPFRHSILASQNGPNFGF